MLNPLEPIHENQNAPVRKATAENVFRLARPEELHPCSLMNTIRPPRFTRMASGKTANSRR